MSNLRIALYQPDIPGNTGTILRLAACLGLQVDIIEPAGFVLSDKNLKRAGMDYLASVAMNRHVNWDRFDAWRLSEGRRLVLASTKAALIKEALEMRQMQDRVVEGAVMRALFPLDNFPHWPRDVLATFGPQINSPLIANGGYDAASGEAALQSGEAALVSFGTPFVANPDLPERFARGAELAQADRATLYGGEDAGFIDYPSL